MPTSSLSQHNKCPPGLGRLDLRDMLLLGGAGQFMADLSIPYMNFLPRTCEPYTQGVQQIVRGLQNLLNKRGASLEVDGGLGRATLRELVKYSGPRWYDKSWSQLYLDVLDGSRWPGYKRLDRTMSRAALMPQAIATGHDGLGADPATPMTGGWTLRSGVAIPLDPGTLALFQSLQRVINAILAKMGKPLIGVDGRIGSATVAAMRLIVLTYGQAVELAGGEINASFVAGNAAAAINELGYQMQKLGAGFVADPKTSKPSTVKADGSIDNPADAGLSSTTIVIGAVAIGAAFALMSKKSRRGSRRR